MKLRAHLAGRQFGLWSAAADRRCHASRLAGEPPPECASKQALAEKSSGQPPHSGLAAAVSVFALLLSFLAAAGCSPPTMDDHPFAFVTAERNSHVTAIDLDRMTVAASIPVSTAPVAVRACPIRNEVYVATRSGRLEFIDTARLKVIASVAVSGSPVRLDLSDDGNVAFILSRVDPVLHQVDLRARRVFRSIRLLPGTEPVAMRMAPNGNIVCVADAAGRQVEIVDLGKRAVVAAVPLPTAPAALEVLRDGSQVYAAEPDGGQVSAIDLNARQLLVHLPSGDGPGELMLKPDGGELLATNTGANTVSIMNSTSDEISNTIPVGAQPSGIAVTRDSSRAFVANTGSNTVSIIDVDNRKVLAAVPAGSAPFRLALTPDERYLLVLNAGSNDVAVIRAPTETPSLLTMLPVGNGPSDIAIKTLSKKRQ